MIETMLNEFKILLLAAFLILFCMVSGSKPIILPDVFIGLFFLIIISMAGLRLRAVFSKCNFPALAWVSTISLICCLPIVPGSAYAVKYISAIDFLSITTPILAFAGISISNKIPELRKLSWKMFIVAFFVFGGRLLLSAIISQVTLSLNS